MMLKYAWTVLVLLGILHHSASVNGNACDGHTPEECERYLRAISRPSGGKRAPAREQSPNPKLAPDLDWLMNTAQQGNEPTCKLKDIFTMVPDDCRVELLQVLHFFVTHSDY